MKSGAVGVTNQGGFEILKSKYSHAAQALALRVDNCLSFDIGYLEFPITQLGPERVPFGEPLKS